MCGRGRVVRYLPDRVMRQFGRRQTIPAHPSEVAPLEAEQIVAAFWDFHVHVVPVAQRGRIPHNPWTCVRGYMRWFENYSHPFMLPRVQGNESPPPRPFNEEVLIEDYHARSGTSSILEMAEGGLRLIEATLMDENNSQVNYRNALAELHNTLRGITRRAGVQPPPPQDD